MSRYFFDLKDGGFEPDAVGTELPDDGAAQREAIRFAGEILKGEPQRLAHGVMRVEVRGQERTRFAIEVNLRRE